MIALIKNGKVEVRMESGVLIRTVGSGDAVFVDMKGDDSLLLITTTKGKVELRKDSGLLIRTFGNDAVEARFHGSDIAIKTSKGKTEIRKESGSLIRTI